MSPALPQLGDLVAPGGLVPDSRPRPSPARPSLLRNDLVIAFERLRSVASKNKSPGLPIPPADRGVLSNRTVGQRLEQRRDRGPNSADREGGEGGPQPVVAHPGTGGYRRARADQAKRSGRPAAAEQGRGPGARSVAPGGGADQCCCVGRSSGKLISASQRVRHPSSQRASIRRVARRPVLEQRPGQYIRPGRRRSGPGPIADRGQPAGGSTPCASSRLSEDVAPFCTQSTRLPQAPTRRRARRCRRRQQLVAARADEADDVGDGQVVDVQRAGPGGRRRRRRPTNSAPRNPRHGPGGKSAAPGATWWAPPASLSTQW